MEAVLILKIAVLCNLAFLYSGKRVKNASEEEEERYMDILLVTELLTNLLSKDFVDFGGRYLWICILRSNMFIIFKS